MNVEYTGRHYEVTPANRKEVETGLSKIRKILRNKFDTKVVLAVEKRRHKAEISINSRVGPLVGLAQAGDMKAAIGEALEHIEKQALSNKTRIISKKRRKHNATGSGMERRHPKPLSKRSPQPPLRPRPRWWCTSSRLSRSRLRSTWFVQIRPSRCVR